MAADVDAERVAVVGVEVALVEVVPVQGLDPRSAAC
jgi:hypothetical protein